MSRIIIRQAKISDAPALLQIYAPFVTDTNISFELEVPALEEYTRRIESTLDRYPYLVCERDGALLGYCYAGPHQDRSGYRFDVNVSVYVSPEHHGRHIGSALYSALFTLLGEQGYYNVYAGISGCNEASAGMHCAMGFSVLGVFRNAGYKRGRWEDMIWMGKSLREHNADPAPTRPISEIDRGLIQSVLENCARMIDQK